jgi:hypothetical protein
MKLPECPVLLKTSVVIPTVLIVVMIALNVAVAVLNVVTTVTNVAVAVLNVTTTVQGVAKLLKTPEVSASQFQDIVAASRAVIPPITSDLAPVSTLVQSSAPNMPSHPATFGKARMLKGCLCSVQVLQRTSQEQPQNRAELEVSQSPEIVCSRSRYGC